MLRLGQNVDFGAKIMISKIFDFKARYTISRPNFRFQGQNVDFGAKIMISENSDFKAKYPISRPNFRFRGLNNDFEDIRHQGQIVRIQGKIV